MVSRISEPSTVSPYQKTPPLNSYHEKNPTIPDSWKFELPNFQISSSSFKLIFPSIRTLFLVKFLAMKLVNIPRFFLYPIPIHGTGIFPYIWLIFMANVPGNQMTLVLIGKGGWTFKNRGQFGFQVGKYTSPMDGMGPKISDCSADESIDPNYHPPPSFA